MSVSKVILQNTQESYILLPTGEKFLTVRDYLSWSLEQNPANQILISGVTIRVDSFQDDKFVTMESSGSGFVSNTSGLGTITSTNQDFGSNTDGLDSMTSSGRGFISNTDGLDTLVGQRYERIYKEINMRHTLVSRNYKEINMTSARVDKSFKEKFNSTYTIYANGDVVRSGYLPVVPQELSDSNSASFAEVSLLGRSVSYRIYNGTSREVSFSLQLHEELSSDYNYVAQVVADLQSACYPEYKGDIVSPPEVAFTIGSQLKVRGVLTNCSASWTPPIIDGRYMNCNLSLGVTETTGPYSMSEVRNRKGFRG